MVIQASIKRVLTSRIRPIFQHQVSALVSMGPGEHRDNAKELFDTFHRLDRNPTYPFPLKRNVLLY
jgi:hypothetical protein